MQEQKDHTGNYKAADFERYHSGKMGAHEMHALEKAALDDPFLADALEGYMNTGTPVGDTQELRVKLEQKDKERKVVPIKTTNSFFLLKIAAVFVLLAGFGWIMYQQRTVKKNEIAALKNSETLPVSSQPDSIQPAQPSKDLAQQEPPSLEKRSENGPANVETRQVEKKESAKESSQEYRVDRGNEHDDLAYDKKVPSASTSPILTEPAKGSVDNVLSEKISGIKTEPVNTIKGKVIDDAGNAVAFATIKDQKNNVTSSTDENGSFLLKTNDTATLLAVNAAGYETARMYVNSNNASNNIVLRDSDKNLSEVVVSSVGSARKKESYSVSAATVHTPRVVIKNAEPVKGWNDFNQYVNTHLKAAPILDSTAVKGVVILSFNVNDSGKAVGLKIKRSLSPASDAEALRIIEDGPLWKQKNKRKKAQATIGF